MIDQKIINRRQFRRSGFTLIELLIVTAMIILLLGILIVALNKATKTAQSTNTRALMTSITQALARFEGDLGYLPPVLDVDRNFIDIPDTNPVYGTFGEYVDKVQEWYSVTTLAEYLLGYGSGPQDGYEKLGLRDPGSNGVWGAPDGALLSRNPVLEGKVYGPYLELKDDHLLGSINGNEENISLPGEGNYNSGDPKVILDYWGQPIRYYRLAYRQGGIKFPYKPDPNIEWDFHLPTLADVFVLRPYNLDPGSATDVVSLFADNNGDTTTSFELKTANFALFSRGADKFWNQKVRFDEDQNNEDNIVEIGQ